MLRASSLTFYGEQLTRQCSKAPAGYRASPVRTRRAARRRSRACIRRGPAEPLQRAVP